MQQSPSRHHKANGSRLLIGRSGPKVPTKPAFIPCAQPNCTATLSRTLVAGTTDGNSGVQAALRFDSQHFAAMRMKCGSGERDGGRRQVTRAAGAGPATGDRGTTADDGRPPPVASPTVKPGRQLDDKQVPNAITESDSPVYRPPPDQPSDHQPSDQQQDEQATVEDTG